MGFVPPQLLFRPRNEQLKEDHPATYQETNAGMDEPVKRLPVSEHADEPFYLDRRLIGERPQADRTIIAKVKK